MEEEILEGVFLGKGSPYFTMMKNEIFCIPHDEVGHVKDGRVI